MNNQTTYFKDKKVLVAGGTGFIGTNLIKNFCLFDIASGKPCSIKEVLNAILEADGYKNAKIVFNASKPTMIPKRLIDASKAKRLLGFEAKTLLLEGIKKTVAWYRETCLNK